MLFCLTCALGVQWHLLHVLDHSNYWQSPRHDYILLPAEARGASTRLRWWQRTSSEGGRHLGWSLDNVHVGGMLIPPSSLTENFERLDETRWEFHPGGRLRRDGVCGSSTGSVMAWDGQSGSAVHMITTCQLIVQHSYMLQFKVPCSFIYINVVIVVIIYFAHKISTAFQRKQVH